MRLANFIRANTTDIANEWESFAGTLLQKEELASSSVLRNSIDKILRKLADNMEQSQTGEQQIEKSRDHTTDETMINTAEHHVRERIRLGLSSRQIISEFRALRASVIRLWRREKSATADSTDFLDLIRFNEAIDELLVEVQSRYSAQTKKSREIVLGILGHDLRNPLSAIAGSAELILRAPDDEQIPDWARQILVSAETMGHLITDLTELTRVNSGKGIAIKSDETDLQSLCKSSVAEAQAAYPQRHFTLRAEDSIVGNWDARKLNQVLTNLLTNAAKHGAAGTDILVTAKKVQDGAEIQVHNDGPAIPQELLPKMFDKFIQEKPDNNAEQGSTGLGLFIAREIMKAHGGTLDVSSSEREGTTFSAYLPPSPLFPQQEKTHL